MALARAKIKTFYINLDRRSDRNESFIARWKNARFPDAINRFSAIDGRDVHPDRTIEHLFRGNDFNFSIGVVGCALSHLTLWRDLTSDNENEAYLIFEDDVLFKDNADEIYTNALNELGTLGAEFDLLYLSGAQPGVRVSLHLATIAKGVGHGTYSYLITKSGAKALCHIVEERGIYRAIDCLMLDYIPPLHGFVCVPWGTTSIAYSADSDIHGIKDSIYD